MIKALSKTFVDKVAYAVRTDKREIIEIVESGIPRRRGEFNVYKAFPFQFTWNKYSGKGLTNADLSWWEKVDKFLVISKWKKLEHRKLGLLYDDLVGNEDAFIIEAINRLPEDVRKARDRRITRAFDLGFHGSELPKEEWTKIEDDVPYLQPYIAWVEHEMDENDAEVVARTDFPVPPIQSVELTSYGDGTAYHKRYLE